MRHAALRSGSKIFGGANAVVDQLLSANLPALARVAAAMMAAYICHYDTFGRAPKRPPLGKGISDSLLAIHAFDRLGQEDLKEVAFSVAAHSL